MEMCVRSLPASRKTRPILTVLSSTLSSGTVWSRVAETINFSVLLDAFFLKSGNIQSKFIYHRTLSENNQGMELYLDAPEVARNCEASA